MSDFAFGYSFSEVVIIAVCVVVALRVAKTYFLMPLKGG